MSIIRSRVDKLGVSEPEIRKEAGNEVSIALAGIKDPKAAATHHRLDRPALHARLHGHARADRVEERDGHRHLSPDPLRTAESREEPPRHALLLELHARAVVRVRQEDAPARAQQHRPAVPARRLEEAADRPTSRGRLRAPCCCARPPARSGPTTRSPPRGGTPEQHRYVMFRMPKDKNLVVFGRDVRNAKSDYDPQSGARRHDGLLRHRHEGVQGESRSALADARPADAGHRGAVRRHPRQQDRGHADDLLPAHAAAASTATPRSRASRPARPTASRSCCSRARCRSRSTRSRSRRSRPRSARTRCARA